MMRIIPSHERTIYLAAKKAQVLSLLKHLIMMMTLEDVAEMTAPQQALLAQTLARIPEEIPLEIVICLQGALQAQGVAA